MRYWTGQENQIYEASYNEAKREADNQAEAGSPDAKRIVQAAAAGAAAGACIAVGAAAASPLCAAIGSTLVEWASGVFEDAPAIAGMAGRQVSNLMVQVLRRELAGEEWSEEKADAYLKSQFGPCNEMLDRIIQERSGFGIDEGALAPVAKCHSDKSNQMFSDFAAIGASKKAEQKLKESGAHIKGKVHPALILVPLGVGAVIFLRTMRRR